MRLNECSPYVTRGGDLRFMMPGYHRSVGGISVWSEGFTPCNVRDGQLTVGKHWPLQLVPLQRGRSLPGLVQAFIDEIPRDVRERVAPYKFSQVPMLQCLAISAEANDLIASNPTLFWLLVTSAFDADWSVEDIYRICRFRQVDIVERINGHATKATVRLLRKIKIDAGTLGESRNILRAISDPRIVSVTAHQQHVSVRFLALPGNYPDLTDPVLANVLARILDSETAQGPGVAGDLSIHLVDIIRMGRSLRIPRPEQAMSQCKSIEEVNRLHDRWVGNINGNARSREQEQREIETFLSCGREAVPAFLRARQRPPVTRISRPDFSTLTFPAQPFPDSEGIKAITTSAELRKEGREQSSCVASYAPIVAGGEAYIYKVLKPARGTLELRRIDGAWLIGQFKLWKNGRPSLEARAHVEKWYEHVCCNP